MLQLLPIFLAYIMFALGLQTHLKDFKEVFLSPKALFAGLVMQLVLVPSVAFILINVFNLSSHLGFGIMLLSICAGGITSNMMSYYAGGKIALSIALTAITSMIAILTVPLWVQLLYPIFFGQLPTDFSILSLALKVLVITTIPVVFGMIIRHFFTQGVDRWQSRLQQMANILFALMVVGATISNWDIMLSQIYDIGFIVLIMATLLMFISFAGSRLFGLSSSERKTLAIEVSLQNGAMGIALASLISSSDKLPAFAMPSAIYGVLMNFVVLPFVFYHAYRMYQYSAKLKLEQIKRD